MRQISAFSVAVIVMLLAVVTAGHASIMVCLVGPDDSDWGSMSIERVTAHPGGGVITMHPPKDHYKYGARPVVLFRAEYQQLCSLLDVPTLEGKTIYWKVEKLRGIHTFSLDRAARAAIQGYPAISISWPPK